MYNKLKYQEKRHVISEKLLKEKIKIYASSSSFFFYVEKKKQQ
jgi:hypothetical protein